ncbi:MAG TPA: alpha/beta hydrolase [Clostridiales bacterium]|jgi:pimeloyl-ACP methyl ester carboxylesterase|nr:alpha/beta hydrolase [Clostridiales bacterium]
MVFDTYSDAKKPTLVLLHGAAVLDTFAHQYGMLAERFHVLVPHLPGAGDAAAQGYNPQETSDALAEWIKSLNAGKVLVMGHSVGGQLAVKLVSEHEELFSRAVFLSPWLGGSDAAARVFAGMARLSYSAVKRASLLRMQAKYWGLTSEQAERLVAYSPRITKETFVGFYANRIYLKDLTGFPSVKIPMLAMCAKGETAEMKASVRQLGEQNTNCLTVIFPQGSHDFVLRNYDLLNPILLDFLTAE